MLVRKFFILVSFFLFGAAEAQNIQVKSIEALTTPEQGQFFSPVVSPSGQLFFSGTGFNGLYMMDPNGKIRTFSSQRGAGYQPAFSADGNYVYFRTHKYEGMKKLSSLIKRTVTGSKEQIIIRDALDITEAKRLSDERIAVSRNTGLFIADDPQILRKNSSPGAAVFIENGKMVLYINAEKKVLTPLGEGFYLWPALSPDGSKLLFTKAGEGTYISTLEGDILAELGYANAPQWSPDGRWVVFMRDLDDGHQLIESDIFIISVDGKRKVVISQTSDIKETYPFWGVENEIVFGSENGIIYKAILEIK